MPTDQPTAEERAKRVVCDNWLTAAEHTRAIAAAIRAAEDVAEVRGWNEAVEACAETIMQDEFWRGRIRALRRTVTP